jgi:hypothetical protein
MHHLVFIWRKLLALVQIFGGLIGGGKAMSLGQAHSQKAALQRTTHLISATQAKPTVAIISASPRQN